MNERRMNVRCKMKKYINSILIVCLLLQLSGCYSFRDISRDDFENQSEAKTLYIKTKFQETYRVDLGNYDVQNDTLYGKGEKIVTSSVTQPFEGCISVNDIESFQIEYYDDEKIMLLLGGIACLSALVLFIAILISEIEEPFLTK